MKVKCNEKDRIKSIDFSEMRWNKDMQVVVSDYWEYVKWRAWHRLFSSMSSIFSTQSLLLAIGIGAKKSLPSAAAINWVLKDGLGRLGRLTVATKFGESFDADLKVCVPQCTRCWLKQLTRIR